MPLDWQALVSDMPDVGKLVHLAMRQTDAEAEAIRAELVKARRRAYESEITIQARRVGCGGRQGVLTSGPALTEMNEESRADAESIVNTYNYDLAREIMRIKADTPAANRNTYVKQLRTWENKRTIQKSKDIGGWTEGTARSRAQQDFVANNDIQGVAILEPGGAREAICQGWLNRGEVPLREAMNNPAPFHLGCPHYWATQPGRVPKSECPNLWVGQ